MKTITFTYDVLVVESDGREIIGETCMDITMADPFANSIVILGEEGKGLAQVEKIIETNEFLKFRTYIKGSIKHIYLNK